MHRFTDSALIHEIQDAGDRLAVSARVARGGNVQEYAGREMGVTDKAVVRVYRPESEVFDTASLATFPHKYVTLDHPPIPAAFDRDAVGWIGDEVMRDGEFIRVPMTIGHRKAIDALKAGKRELSVGYLTEIVFESGVSPTGESYDARMTKIVVDHVAIVDAARGGSQLRIGDWRAPDDRDRADNPSTEKSNMSDTKTRTILVDGLSVETTDAGAQAIAKLQGQIKDAAEAAEKLAAEHTAAIAAKDADLAKRDAEIDSLKAKVLSDTDLDARVKARADLIAVAKGIADADYTGKSDMDIRRTVVATKLGDAAVKDKPDAYIEARFDILAEDAKTDPVRKTLIQGVDRKTVGDNGYSASVAGLDYRNRDTKKEG